MKQVLVLSTIIVLCILSSSCKSFRSSAEGFTDTEIPTIIKGHGNFELEVDPQSITYTIDISTPEGRGKLNGLTKSKARKLALEQAAIKNSAARIVSPKFDFLQRGKREILRVTVFGFPARYKNTQPTSTSNSDNRTNVNVNTVVNMQ